MTDLGSDSSQHLSVAHHSGVHSSHQSAECDVTSVDIRSILNTFLHAFKQTILAIGVVGNGQNSRDSL